MIEEHWVQFELVAKHHLYGQQVVSILNNSEEKCAL